ncbi:Phosphoglucosamine mutase [Pseudoalteromonas sp. CIP111854]|uniref:Phosphoglucosamine mutase n=1 Tax=Pseudoalteromonas holothuriae TaxID=2963714 RepID=A0A9W4R1T5_9GAMM|nr:phosphomannomutase [Pseudoalteromonas sp. CIP111854]CAH9062869.1 Phosphoglucosamine mutase [Pseudoalteromonas sp. CIP111854]
MAVASMYSNDVIVQSGVRFGTSGARGLVSQFTPQVCGAFTLAFMAQQTSAMRVAIAIDNRPSSVKIAQACIAALKHYGYEVEYYGVVPTPALAYAAQLLQLPAIMVTGSHIPHDRNGLKFYRCDGEIDKTDEQAIINAQICVPQLQLEALPQVSYYAQQQYIKRYVTYFPSDLLSGKRIGVYQHTSAGRDIYPSLFAALGGEVVNLGYSEEFVAIDTEAIGELDKQQAKKWTKEYQLDVLFSTDGDGDRPLLADERGEYLAGDILCLLAAQYLNINALAIPVNCNTALELSGAFEQIVRTKIGSVYVINAIKTLQDDNALVAGFEANGGFLLASDIYDNHRVMMKLETRDALLPVLCVLAMLGQNKLSNLLLKLPQRFTYSDRIENVELQKSTQIVQFARNSPYLFLDYSQIQYQGRVHVDNTDGVRILLESGDIIHLRPSGNAPEFRCYVDCDNKLNAQRLVMRVLSSIKNMTRA